MPGNVLVNFPLVLQVKIQVHHQAMKHKASAFVKSNRIATRAFNVALLHALAFSK
jgi:hypothetical protein